MPMNMRPKGENHWYSPERDLLNVWPSTLMKAAAYAADGRSSINKWLITQVPKEDASSRIRKQLQLIIMAIKEGKSSKLEDILSPDIIDWPVFQSIMFAAGILMFKSYNKFYRGNRLTDVHGGVQDPVGSLDELGIMRAYDELVEKSKLII